ncbi:cytochrome c-type biogenesis protein CcmH [Variovorax sp. J22P271]|uniref:cytochrome c-type biogenesis protein n=1 Tax=Variovorax davisae TaxID=3053515 RepID=UPI0025784DB4|nr:cytochrome c-type biogenesis protein [Variovorax sp. J22P271]MDM0034417.1 cytochrome c-type biogenesis protein CcmH [Variovorax sp. J22P271]
MPRRMAALWPALALATAIAAPSEAQLDARVHALSQQLRCVVCQNQTLADSQAELAVDLRRQIREQLRSGAGDEAVKAYLVQRYGDFVLYDPPLKPATWLLWFGPLLLLALAALAVVRSRRRRPAAPAPLDEAARQRADALLGASNAASRESGR